jgi:hypothetical protein
MIKYRRMQWKEHVAHFGEKRDPYNVLLKIPVEKRLHEDLGIDSRIISK